jgi:hypothetical protein
LDVPLRLLFNSMDLVFRFAPSLFQFLPESFLLPLYDRNE